MVSSLVLNFFEIYYALSSSWQGCTLGLTGRVLTWQQSKRHSKISNFKIHKGKSSVASRLSSWLMVTSRVFGASFFWVYSPLETQKNELQASPFRDASCWVCDRGRKRRAKRPAEKAQVVSPQQSEDIHNAQMASVHQTRELLSRRAAWLVPGPSSEARLAKRHAQARALGGGASRHFSKVFSGFMGSFGGNWDLQASQDISSRVFWGIW